MVLLSQVATMNIGLEDTLAYYSPEEFAAGFKKTMAFQPRVIKQNRGSSGEGIWIIKLKAENYCKTYGERWGDFWCHKFCGFGGSPENIVD